jgi:hypothetical protein
MPPTFIDHHPYTVNAAYPFTNEEPKDLQEVLDSAGVTVLPKVGGICGGGDICLSTLLPRTSEACVVIDHSYVSLAAALTKVHLLEKVGPREFLRIFSKQSQWSDDVFPQIQAITATLPDEVKKVLQANHYHSALSYDTWVRLRDIWALQKEETLEASFKAIQEGKLTVVHGDLNDLSNWGPFDLVYLSNAMGHSGRTENEAYAKASAERNQTKDWTIPLPSLKFQLKAEKFSHPNTYILQATDISAPGVGNLVAGKKGTSGLRWFYALSKVDLTASIPTESAA